MTRADLALLFLLKLGPGLALLYSLWVMGEMIWEVL